MVTPLRVKPEYRHLCRDAQGLIIGEALVYRDMPAAQLAEIVRDLGRQVVVRPYDEGRTEVFLTAIQREPDRAWLIEDGRSSPAAPLYLTVSGSVLKPAFTTDLEQAVRFAREQDARDAARLFDLKTYRIAEHQWG